MESYGVDRYYDLAGQPLPSHFCAPADGLRTPLPLADGRYGYVAPWTIITPPRRNRSTTFIDTWPITTTRRSTGRNARVRNRRARVRIITLKTSRQDALGAAFERIPATALPSRRRVVTYGDKRFSESQFHEYACENWFSLNKVIRRQRGAHRQQRRRDHHLFVNV